nr:RNA-directed DNA polymerase, eukaryota [Tanacetum cinerariifolium]
MSFIVGLMSYEGYTSIELDTYGNTHRGGLEEEQYNGLCSMISDISLPNMFDRWFWSLDGTGEFLVRSVVGARSFISQLLCRVAQLAFKHSFIQGHEEDSGRNLLLVVVDYLAGSIIVNGSPTEEFQFWKGLKQGDPLSPFLFILIMESLHISFQRVVDAGMFKGISLGGGTINLSHMFFVNDAVFVGKWCESNINTLVNVLECFYKASGLRINMSKSKIIGVNVDTYKINRAANRLGCLVFNTPFMYLGSIIGGKMAQINTWRDTMEKVKNRLSNWKMNMLPIGGRLTLVKSVLGTMPLYQFSLFKVPMGVLNYIETLRSRFLNGCASDNKKAIWMNWKNALAPKDRGGLGISSLYAMNRGLLFKWIWRFLTQKKTMWARVIQAIHGVDGKIGSNNKGGYGSCWTNIVQEFYSLVDKGVNVFQYLRLHVGNGEDTKFWEDRWFEGGVLKDRFHRLYALETSKDIVVGRKMMHPCLSFSFGRNPRGGLEMDQLANLKDLMKEVYLNSNADRWSWLLDKSGVFAVSSVRNLIDEKILPKTEFQTRWNKCVLIKINVHTWKIMTNSLPTRFNISRRDISLPNMSDRWFWSLDGTGEFSVRSVRCLIDDALLPKSDTPTRWVKLIPIKVVGARSSISQLLCRVAQLAFKHSFIQAHEGDSGRNLLRVVVDYLAS